MTELKQAQLICLCASHLASMERSAKLVHLFQTVLEQQTVQPKQIHISVSFDAKLDAKQVTEIKASFTKLKDAAGSPGRFVIHEQPHSLKQFEHYAWLAQNVEVDAATWVLFSDDDDKWHKQRVECVVKAIGGHTQETLNGVYLPWKGHEAYQYYGGTDEAFLSCYTGEYVNYAVPMAILRAFCRGASVGMLQHRFCDMLFVQFVRHYRPTRGAFRVLSLVLDIELYEWIRQGADHASKSYADGSSHKSDAPVLKVDAKGGKYVSMDDFVAKLAKDADNDMALYLATNIRDKHKDAKNFLVYMQSHLSRYPDPRSAAMARAKYKSTFEEQSATHVFGRSAVQKLLNVTLT